MEMLGVMLKSWPRMLVLLKLMVRPKSLQACAKERMRRCNVPSVYAVRAASSVNSINLGLRSEACKVEEVSIASGVKVHTIF